MNALLKSRKFKLTLAAALAAAAGALTGEITWGQALAGMIPVVLANIFGIAWEDVAAKSRLR